jgi:hypothetical protein
MIANMGPETIEEIYALVPSLKVSLLSLPLLWHFEQKQHLMLP